MNTLDTNLPIKHESLFGYYSIGVVAAAKPEGDPWIDVTPIEITPMLEGELNPTPSERTISATNDKNIPYTATIVASKTIRAKWLPIHSTHRHTAPDVQSGEIVLIYRYGEVSKDDNEYRWHTLENDFKLRRLETITWLFPGLDTPDVEATMANSYYLHISTKNKLVRFHTSADNGEPFKYDLEFNTNDGLVTLTDDVNNHIRLNSRDTIIELKNKDNVHVELNKKNLNVIVPGNTTFNTTGNTIINTEGNTTIATVGDTTISSQGNTTIDTDGDNTVNTKGSNAIQASGNTKIESEEDTSIKTSGNTRISTEGTTNLESTGRMTLGSKEGIGFESDGGLDIVANGNLTIGSHTGTLTITAPNTVVNSNIHFTQSVKSDLPIDAAISGVCSAPFPG